MYERISLIYVPNDHHATFQQAEKRDEKYFELHKVTLQRLDTFYPWMLERGYFFKFSVETEVERVSFDRCLGLLSALGVPAFVIEDYPFIYNDLFKFFTFENFSQFMLSVWYSKKMSSMFDNVDVVSVDDFKGINVTYCSNFKYGCVNIFPTLERFERGFSEFLFNYKSIICYNFYESDKNNDEEELPW